MDGMPGSVVLVDVMLEAKVSVMVKGGFSCFLSLPNIFERRFIVSLNSGCCRLRWMR